MHPSTGRSPRDPTVPPITTDIRNKYCRLSNVTPGPAPFQGAVDVVRLTIFVLCVIVTPMEKAPVLVERPAPGVVVLTFNRPDFHNALDTGLQRMLDEQLTALEADASVRCLVFTGAGDAA